MTEPTICWSAISCELTNYKSGSWTNTWSTWASSMQESPRIKKARLKQLHEPRPHMPQYMRVSGAASFSWRFGNVSFVQTLCGTYGGFRKSRIGSSSLVIFPFVIPGHLDRFEFCFIRALRFVGEVLQLGYQAVQFRKANR